MPPAMEVAYPRPLRIHLPSLRTRCGRCRGSADPPFFDGRRHVCEECFDVGLERLRKLPSGSAR